MDQKELLAAAALHAEDAIVICENKENYPIVFVNETFSKSTGYSLEEVLGKNPGRLLQGEDTDLETRIRISNKLKNKKVVREDILNYTKDGTPYWVEVHIYPYQKYFISIQRCITERKRMESELEEYKKFFNESPVALFRTDLETGQFIMANKCAAYMLGFNSVDSLLDNFKSTDLYPSKDRKELIKKLKRSNIKDYEIKLVVNGKDIWVSANLHINCGGTCIEGSFVDITTLVGLRDKNLEMLQKVGEQLEKKITSLAG